MAKNSAVALTVPDRVDTLPRVGDRSNGPARHSHRRRAEPAGPPGATTDTASHRRGRHQAGISGRRRWWLLVAAPLVLVVALPVVWAATGPSSDAPGRACRTPAEVQLAVDPSLADPVSGIVERSVVARLDCVRLVVSVRPSAEVAAEISRRSGQGLAGTLPDLWLPESRLWLAVARRTGVGASRVAGDFPTVAQTPVVLALPGDRAGEIRWPPGRPPITARLGSADGSVALTDPSKDVAGLATLLQVGAAAAPGAGDRTIVDFARRVRLPRAAQVLDAVADGRLAAVTSTERAVVTHNRGVSVAARVSAYGGTAPPDAVVPLVQVRAGGRPTRSREGSLQQATDALRRALLGPTGQASIRAAGFRDRSGRLDRRFTPVRPLVAARLPRWAEPGDGQVRSVIDSWGTLGRRGRVLVTVDASGSMAARLPGRVTTKSGLARQALSAVVSSIAPDSDMGLWTFTASRGRDYRVLVPLGPADGKLGGSTRRQTLQRRIGSVTPVPGGGTGLYDTTLAAFRAASRDYAYGRLNAVMVITDGRNQDPGSITLTTLLDVLRREFDGIKPVRILTVAYGADADLTGLRRIADVTGGASYRAPTAADVAPLLAKALADL